MRTTSRLRAPFVAAAAVTSILFAAAALSAPPAPADTAAPAPADTASPAAPSAASPAAENTASPAAPDTTSPAAPDTASPAAPAAPSTPLLPVLRGSDLPAEASDKPKESEWRGARRISVTRGHPGACELFVVREWLRVVCPSSPGLGLVAGDPRGVTTWVTGDHINGNPITARVQLPIRRGSSRIVTLQNLDGGGWDALAAGEESHLSVTWPAGEESPTVAIYPIQELD